MPHDVASDQGLPCLLKEFSIKIEYRPDIPKMANGLVYNGLILTFNVCAVDVQFICLELNVSVRQQSYTRALPIGRIVADQTQHLSAQNLWTWSIFLIN